MTNSDRDQSNHLDWKTVVLIVGISALGLMFLWNLLLQKKQTEHLESITTGPIRSNINSGLFYVPTCPHYDKIGPQNMKEFDSVFEAEMAGYEGSSECLDSVRLRKLSESGMEGEIFSDYEHGE